MSISIVIRFALLATVAATLAGCPGGSDIVPAMKQLPAEAQVLMAKQGMRAEAPIFVRIFKEESQLEVWKQKDDGRFYHFKTYPICAWSGELGPKVAIGDKQAPEGFYTVTPGQMNPNSQFHLAFNLGYPNAYDRANGHTGDALMVHGDCRSAGCFAMTDALIEEIYILAREAFQGGQTNFQVHAFPFRMTAENLNRHKGSKWAGFWRALKEGFDAFEISRVPPKVAVCSRQYLVNANFFGQVATPDPSGECPAFQKIPAESIDPFRDGPMQVKAPGAPGQNTRVASYGAPPSPAAAAQMQSTTNHLQQNGGSAPAYQPNAQTSAPQQAALTSMPATTRQPLPAVQPSSAAPSAPEQAPASGAADSFPTTQDESAPQEPRQVVTRGLHNVVESGKSDMISVNKAPAVQPQQPAYGYGQNFSSGSSPD